MASGFLVAGTDLDSLLDPIGTNTPISNVGLLVAGTDIAQRYAPASVGTPGAATGFLTSGTDVGPLFAAIGTTGNYTGTLTSVLLAPTQFGYLSGVGGSMSPTTFRGHVIGSCYTNNTTNQTFFSVASASSLGAGFFNTIKIGAATAPLLTSAATYSYVGGQSTWIWPNVRVAATGSIPVTTT